MGRLAGAIVFGSIVVALAVTIALVMGRLAGAIVFGSIVVA